MKWLIMLFIVFIIYGMFSDRWLRKKLKIDKSNWTFYRHVNTLHKWVEGTIVILFLAGIWFVEDSSTLLIAFFFILFSIRAFMEWKYQRTKREYIMTLYTLFNCLLFLGIVFILIEQFSLI